MGSSGIQCVTQFRKCTFRLRLSAFSSWDPVWDPVGSSVLQFRKCTFRLRLSPFSGWDPSGIRRDPDSMIPRLFLVIEIHGHGPSWGLEIHLPFCLHVWLRRFVQERFYSFACSSKILVMTGAVASFAPAGTWDGELPPWEVAKAVAYHVVLSDVSQFLETSASDLVGMRVDDYIAGKVFLQGGGHPQGSAVPTSLLIPRTWPSSLRMFCRVCLRR